MPWGWTAPTAPLSVSVGGNVGTWEESKQSNSWPSQEADYLKKRMLYGNRHPEDKFNIDDLPLDYRDSYLQKVSDNYKQEANEQLKMEFNEWLQGTHETNKHPKIYENLPGQTKRVHMKSGVDMKGEKYWPGKVKEDFNVTPWGLQGLTQLEGVREYLRAQKEKDAQNTFALNVLAEEGPQNLEEAWQYFKTWVKGRTQAEGAINLRPDPMDDTYARYTRRSAFGPKQPDRTIGYPMDVTPEGREWASSSKGKRVISTLETERKMAREALEREALFAAEEERDRADKVAGAKMVWGLLSNPPAPKTITDGPLVTIVDDTVDEVAEVTDAFADLAAVQFDSMRAAIDYEAAAPPDPLPAATPPAPPPAAASPTPSLESAEELLAEISANMEETTARLEESNKALAEMEMQTQQPTQPRRRTRRVSFSSDAPQRNIFNTGEYTPGGSAEDAYDPYEEWPSLLVE